MRGLGHGTVLALRSGAQKLGFFLPSEQVLGRPCPQRGTATSPGIILPYGAQEKLQQIFDGKPWRICPRPTCFFYMLINIIAASRRIGDVIMCNEVDLKVKKAMLVNILS